MIIRATIKFREPPTEDVLAKIRSYLSFEGEPASMYHELGEGKKSCWMYDMYDEPSCYFIARIQDPQGLYNYLSSQNITLTHSEIKTEGEHHDN